eukprot:GEMP01043441.1.p1 GENE.GEMP01043441.1~~GEMP01043441.1.p1  ORF type:complete len:412 (+),score=84.89 GEMP01043441.1:168-1403(+)
MKTLLKKLRTKASMRKNQKSRSPMDCAKIMVKSSDVDDGAWVSYPKNVRHVLRTAYLKGHDNAHFTMDGRQYQMDFGAMRVVDMESGIEQEVMFQSRGSSFAADPRSPVDRSPSSNNERQSPTKTRSATTSPGAPDTIRRKEASPRTSAIIASATDVRSHDTTRIQFTHDDDQATNLQESQKSSPRSPTTENINHVPANIRALAHSRAAKQAARRHRIPTSALPAQTSPFSPEVSTVTDTPNLRKKKKKKTVVLSPRERADVDEAMCWSPPAHVVARNLNSDGHQQWLPSPRTRAVHTRALRCFYEEESEGDLVCLLELEREVAREEEQCDVLRELYLQQRETIYRMNRECGRHPMHGEVHDILSALTSGFDGFCRNICRYLGSKHFRDDVLDEVSHALAFVSHLQPVIIP